MHRVRHLSPDPEAIKADRNIRIRKGTFEAEVNSPDDDKPQ